MSTKIRVRFKPGGQLTCTNASREKISVQAPGWPDYIEVRPNSRFDGDFQSRKVETLAPVVPTSESAPYPACVRKATEADIDELFLLVPQLLSETMLLPVSSQRAEKLVERCAMGEGGAIAGIIDGPDGIDASVGLDVAESDVSDHKYVRVRWLGLHPNLRTAPAAHGDPRSNHGRRLFEFAKWYHSALEQQAGHPVLMQFDLATRAALGPKLGFYERNATPVGAVFAYLSGGAFLARGDADAA